MIVFSERLASASKWRNPHRLVVNADLKFTPEAQASGAAQKADPEKASIESQVLRRTTDVPAIQQKQH
jgi:hypothetical protein